MKFSQRNSHGRILQAALFCVISVLLLQSAGRASDWQPIDSTTDGIQIFKKEVSGSRLVAFRGVGAVEAPLLVVATILFDTDRRREWIDGLGESRILCWNDIDNFIEYDHIHLPFFMQDRDFVSRITVTFDQAAGQMVFHYQPSHDPYAPRAGYIRGETEATFILRAQSDTRTMMDAEFVSDPKGLIPTWLVNYFLKDWPKTTFRNLRGMARNSDIPIEPRFSDLTAQGTKGQKKTLAIASALMCSRSTEK